MAIEKQVLANMHRAIDQGDFAQVEKQAEFLDQLKTAKLNGFIDYDQPTTANLVAPHEPIEINEIVVINDSLIKLNGNEIILAPRALSVLKFLGETPLQVVSSNRILQRVWGEGDPTNVAQVVKRLRRDMEIDPKRPKIIISNKKLGYVLNARFSFAQPQEV